MSEIRVNNVIADNGLDAVNFTKGINVSSGIITATSFIGNVTGNVTTDKIIPTGGVPSGGGGGIIQITQSQDGKEQVNFNTSSELDLMTAQITPKFATSNILLIINCNGVGSQSSTFWQMRIRRNQPSTTYLPAVADYCGIEGDNGDLGYPCKIQLDSPATTNTITYTISGIRRQGSGTCYWSHQNGLSDESESRIVLMEVSA